MRQNLIRNLFTAVAFAAVAVISAQPMPVMPAIPVDTAVRIGTLDNGLTYYIRYNNWPENRADFYIAQKVGSLQEEENQRGLAHFLEHMCFNGTDNFEGNSLIRYCESIGVKFGRDLNAYTSIDETVYNISNVPTTSQSALDSCLLILRDWADGLTLDPEEIDKERGVIHEEWRLRTSAQSRMLERNLPALYPNSKYGLRYPIGLMSVVDNFEPQELRDYYEKWYHPANQGIIVVGDVNVDYIEEEIIRLFGPMTNPVDMAPILEEPVPDNDDPIIIIDKDKEQQVNFEWLMIKHDVFPDSLKTSPAYIIYNYVVDAAMAMLDSRLDEKGLEPDCPYASAGVDDDSYIYAKTKDAFLLQVVPKEMNLTNEAVRTAFTEVLRAARYGFTPTEYERHRQDVLSSIEKQYSNKDKRYNSSFYRECKNHFLSAEPMPSIDYYYEFMTQVVPMIPLESVNAFMSELIPDDNINLVVLSLNNETEEGGYPTAEALLAAIDEARDADIEPFVDNVKDEPLISQLPEPGTIVAESYNELLDYTELTLSNGATVVLKHTDLKKDQVLLSGEGEGGTCMYGEDDYANLRLFGSAIGVSGLGAFSSTELTKALAGKIANADLAFGGELKTTISGSSTPKDMETMLQMAYLYFTNINKDQKSFDSMMQQLEVALKNRELSPETAFSDSISVTLYNHDPRKKPLTIDDLSEVSYDRILEIARERTANAATWTFTIIGNYDEATIRPLICQYLASLPSSENIETGSRLTYMQKGEISNIFYRKQETPKANAYIVWHNDVMDYSLETSIRADMAGQILTMIYLKKIREDAGAAYSVSAQATAGLGDDGYFNIALMAYCPMTPEKRDEAARILFEEEQQLAEECDADMLTKVKEYIIKRVDDAAKTNGYWDSAIDMYRKHGIDTHTQYKATVEAQTPQDICKFMKEFNSAGNRITIMMLPEE